MLCTPLLPILAIFAQTTYQNDAIGIKIELPEGATVVATSSEPPFCMISSGNPSNIWHLRLETGLNPESKPPKALLQKPSNSANKGNQTIDNRALNAGVLEGWLNVGHINGPNGQELLARFVLPTDDNHFILASFKTNPVLWAQNKVLFEHTVQSIVPLDQILLLTNHIEGQNAATELLGNLSIDSLSKLIGFKEWRRIQSTGTLESPPTDIGYAYIQIERGNHKNVGTIEGPVGLESDGIIITIRSRMVPNLHTGVVTDAFARYWMSWDGKEERWSNQVTRWMDKVSATESEIGLRNRPETGSPRSRLIVLQHDLTSDVRETPFKVLVKEPWLPRALVWVLGPLLAKEVQDKHYIWRTYENSGDVQRIETRTDTVRILPNGNKIITTQLGDLEESLWTTVDATGALIRQEQKNGAIVTGSTKEVLKDIWSPRQLW
jgi:hypothetical protein